MGLIDKPRQELQGNDVLRCITLQIAHQRRLKIFHYINDLHIVQGGPIKALPKSYKELSDYRYSDIFLATSVGHYKLIFIQLGCIFDTDTRAASMRNLKLALKIAGQKEMVDGIDTALDTYKKLVSEITSVRSKLTAHKELGSKAKDVYARSAITPDEIGALIDSCAMIINRVNDELFGVGPTLSSATSRFETATLELLPVVKRGRV